MDASREFCRGTGIFLALSMSEEGLLLTTPDEQWFLTPPSAKTYLPDGLGQNVIGCGDALVGTLAYEYGRTKNILDAAKLGLASAHFNLSTFGVPEINAEQVRDLVAQVRVQNILD
jgi:fructose-1-phosphate kinase PfkB-like protein